MALASRAERPRESSFWRKLKLVVHGRLQCDQNRLPVTGRTPLPLVRAVATGPNRRVRGAEQRHGPARSASPCGESRQGRRRRSGRDHRPPLRERSPANCSRSPIRTPAGASSREVVRLHEETGPFRDQLPTSACCGSRTSSGRAHSPDFGTLAVARRTRAPAVTWRAASSSQGDAQRIPAGVELRPLDLRHRADGPRRRGAIPSTSTGVPSLIRTPVRA